MELEEEGGSRSRGGERLVPRVLDVGGLEAGAPVKSLLVRRCMFAGSSGMLPVLISSNVGVAPKYHAEGEDGDLDSRVRSSGNIGFGLCILPSEPLRRRVVGIPQPKSGWVGLDAKSSPNKGLRSPEPMSGAGTGARSIIEFEAREFVLSESVRRVVL